MKKIYLLAFIIIKTIAVEDCIYNLTIKLKNLDISDNKRTEKTKYKGQTVKIKYKLEISEELLKKDKKTILQQKKQEEIRTIESEIIKIPKINEAITKNKYYFKIRIRNVYWKEYKKRPKYFDFNLFQVKSFNTKNQMDLSHYEAALKTIRKLDGKNSIKEDQGYYNTFVNCDTQLPLVQINKRFIEFNSHNEKISGACSIISKTVKSTNLDLNFEFGIDFLGKNYLRKGGSYFEEFFLERGGFGKFKSLPFKSQIGKFSDELNDFNFIL